MTKNSLEIRGKGHFAKLGTRSKTNPKFIKRSRRKSAQSKLGKKKTKLRFIWVGLSRDFSLLGRLMKTLISQHLAKYATNFLLLCSARRAVNKICKSRSQTKAREKGQQSAGGLSYYDTFRSRALVTLKHSFNRISRSS